MGIKVKLRQKPINDNMLSLYLDFYPPIIDLKTGKKTRREFLGKSIHNEVLTPKQKYIDKNGKENEGFVPMLDGNGKPKRVKLTKAQLAHNVNTLAFAETVRKKRQNELDKPEIYSPWELEQKRKNEACLL